MAPPPRQAHHQAATASAAALIAQPVLHFGLVGLLALVLAACGAAPSGSNKGGVALPLGSPPLPPTPDAAAVAVGRDLYRRQCATCHGANAEGAATWQTPSAAGRTGAPPHDDTGHTWRHGDPVLAEVIRNGMPEPGKPDAPLRMPAFGDRLSEADVRAIIEYFKSLWSPDHRAFQINETLHPAATAAP